jgi:hypothetical protein
MNQSQPNKPKTTLDDPKVFKGAPRPDPDQAVESGEPTLTGDATDDKHPSRAPAEPKEGAHWESGRQSAE